MTSWQALEEELQAWAGEGRRAQMWWRDDDAGDDSPALLRLLEMAGSNAPPLVMAAIPAALSEAAAARINERAAKGMAVTQHGYAHANHARAGEKKIELGGNQPVRECAAQLRSGREILARRLPRLFLPVLVPPWNRIDAALIPRLPALGFSALSTYGARKTAQPKTGLARINCINCHVDILDWRAKAAFVGEAEALKLACAHLSARRRGEADPDEPTGILSHHGRQDEAAWRFLAEFFARTAAHPGAHWPQPDSLFGAPAA